MLRTTTLFLLLATAGSTGQGLAQTDRSGVFPPNNLSALSQSRAKSLFRKLVEQRGW